MSFQQGLSGLNASSKALDVTGNNVANAGTVGFKSAASHFSDVYAASLFGRRCVGGYRCKCRPWCSNSRRATSRRRTTRSTSRSTAAALPYEPEWRCYVFVMASFISTTPATSSTISRSA